MEGGILQYEVRVEKSRISAAYEDDKVLGLEDM